MGRQLEPENVPYQVLDTLENIAAMLDARLPAAPIKSTRITIGKKQHDHKFVYTVMIAAIDAKYYVREYYLPTDLNGSLPRYCLVSGVSSATPSDRMDGRTDGESIYNALKVFAGQEFI